MNGTTANASIGGDAAATPARSAADALRRSPIGGRTDAGSQAQPQATGLYTPEERIRRDATVWTLVQGILAPVQFVVFLVSLALVLRYLGTGEGYLWATVSVIAKTCVLYLIMVTGAIWEKVVFGRYLFAGPFFWEDVVSMGVIALHTAYLAAIIFNIGTPTEQMWLALAAYATYVVNAAQFIWKLRMARLQAAGQTSTAGSGQ